MSKKTGLSVKVFGNQNKVSLAENTKGNISKSRNSLSEQIANLQSTIGNQGVLRLLSSGFIQAKPGPNPASTGGTERTGNKPGRPSSSVSLHIRSDPSHRPKLPSVPELHPHPQPTVTDWINDRWLAGYLRTTYGTPLSTPLRRQMEARWRRPFGSVGLHVSGPASALVGRLGARAATLGEQIAFAPGAYRPNQPEGQKLVFHELGHVVHHRQATKISRPDYELKAYNRARSGAIHPAIGASIFPPGMHLRMRYILYSAEAQRIRSALAALIGAGRVREYRTGNVSYFHARWGTAAQRRILRAQIAAALQRRGLPNPTGLADAILSRHRTYDIATVVTLRSYPFLGLHVSKRTRIGRLTSRFLTEFEISEALRVFGRSLGRIRQVRIEHGSLIGKILTVGGYARAIPKSTIAYPVGSTISMPWMIHELTHIWQYEHGYSVLTTLCHAVRSSSNYGGVRGLRQAARQGKSFLQFNTEQQGDILQHYYEILIGQRRGRIAAYQPFVREVQRTPPRP